MGRLTRCWNPVASGLARGLWPFLLCGILPLLSAQPSPAGPEIQRTLRQLGEVPSLIAQKDFSAALRILDPAIPLLQTLVETDAGARPQYINALYLKGVCHLETQEFSSAEQAFSLFLRRFPNEPTSMRARLLLGEALLQQQKWADIPPAVSPVLASRTTPFPEQMFSHQLLGEARFQLDLWEEAMPHLQWLYRNATDPTLRYAAAGQLAVCMLRLERFADLYQVMPHLYRTEARYDIPLNLTLLEEGDRFLQSERPDLALLLYRLVTPYAHLKASLEQRRASAHQRLQNLRRLPALADSRPLRELERQIAAIDAREEEIAAYPDYDIELRIRLGDVYYQLQRWEEALQVFLSVHTRFPGHELAERAMYSAYMAAFLGDDPQRAWDIAQLYMAAYPAGEFWDDVTLHASGLLVGLERWAQTAELVDKALLAHPEHASADNLLYMKGYAQFMLNDIRPAMETFRRALREHPRSSFLVNFEYWIALGHLFLQEYPQARDAFRKLVDRGRGGPLREDAYYRLSQAEYGLGDFEAAKRVLEGYLAEYPDAVEGSSAWAMIGDIQASWGQLDEALLTYKTAVDTAKNMVQADYATFQQARTFEMERKWTEIIALFEDYNQRFSGKDANFTEATYWIGTALKQLGKQKEALQVFYDTIVRYGDDPRAYGVDFILRDLLEELSSVRESDVLLLDLRERLNREMDTALQKGQRTLLLRLEGLQYETTRNPELKELLRQRLLKPEALEFASPFSLAQMGRIGEMARDLPFTRAVHEHFIANFEDSDLILGALVGLSDVRIQEEKYPEALEMLKAITDRFPTQPEAAEAWMRIGDIHRSREAYDKAEEVYTLILSVKEWRGELWPRALLKLGDTHNEAGDPTKAFGFYQRVYVLYGGYPEQAATAYYRSALMLQKLGKVQEARDTLREMLEQPALASRPIAQDARALMTRL